MRRTIAASLGKMPTTSVRRLISALTRSSGVRRCDLCAMRFVKAHERQHVVLGIAEHDRELRKLRGELIRDDVPLCACGFGRLLRERRFAHWWTPGDLGLQPGQVYDVIRRAYDYRSTLSHGKTVNETKLVSIRGSERYTYERIVAVTETITRMLL